MEKRSVFVLIYLIACLVSCTTDPSLQNGPVRLSWEESSSGWKISEVLFSKPSGGKVAVNAPSGMMTVLFSPDLPAGPVDTVIYNNQGKPFPDKEFTYIQSSWRQVLDPVRLNTAGTAFSFFPENVRSEGNALVFSRELEIGRVEAAWEIDRDREGAFIVTISLEASQPGYYSLASPDLFYTEPDELAWGIVPGHYQGRQITDDLPSSLVYAQGLPAIPYIARENTLTTLTSILSNRQGVSYSVSVLPGYGRDPWATDQSTHLDTRLGLSHMNRNGRLTPTAYYPLLNHSSAKLAPGDRVSFTCKYTVTDQDWFSLLKQTATQDYQLENFLSLKESSLSLTHRIFNLLDYSLDDETSMWNEMQSGGMKIGAQSYLGGVESSSGDATKNSDIGAMWMMANLTNLTDLKTKRLPLIRNFKLQQIEGEGSKISGAIKGQYYLSKSDKWVEEWGDHTEPIALTYYNMLDLGNILLFDPHDEELREVLSLGAERLLNWQKSDGSWAAGYLKDGKTEVYQDLKDYRPTFYGLLVAYRILGDQRYLEAAIKGANWLLEEGVQNGYFTGVCGDTRFVNDFATAQVAQALLDLWEITGNETYKEAAVFTARIYTSSIYTHPIPDKRSKVVNGREVPDWAISQVGLGFEHGGNLGSATGRGPILLASHAGLFLRVSQLTGDPYFAMLARTAIWGRDAFLHPENKVASYYWASMNAGAGKFPHHAWWQIGMLTDYLVAEVAYRSAGALSFPMGFFTPKVGPHKTVGFQKGEIFGKSASLFFQKELVSGSSPYLDYLGARAEEEEVYYIILLNNSAHGRTEQLKVNLPHESVKSKPFSLRNYDATGKSIDIPFNHGEVEIDFPPYSMRVLEISGH
ncbi:hypothetical protein ADIS_1245 [Lunatimonas lonarensis]|uniref:Glycerophosphoryl diester phosphodiesterase n=1 Tax=Lunatimonas lonarensis TaxID=1232681 RepID=R7ZWC1_9BACT|nr:hypothetical protein [Lunatimonas lonarensis]EON78382.1 hypothetical protein ADIS_1245 [Lunatimonas lonarensis]